MADSPASLPSTSRPDGLARRVASLISLPLIEWPSTSPKNRHHPEICPAANSWCTCLPLCVPVRFGRVWQATVVILRVNAPLLPLLPVSCSPPVTPPPGLARPRWPPRVDAMRRRGGDRPIDLADYWTHTVGRLQMLGDRWVNRDLRYLASRMLQHRFWCRVGDHPASTETPSQHANDTGNARRCPPRRAAWRYLLHRGIARVMRAIPL